MQGKRRQCQAFGAASQEPQWGARRGEGSNRHRLNTQVEEREGHPRRGLPAPFGARAEARKNPECHAEGELHQAAEQVRLMTGRPGPAASC